MSVQSSMDRYLPLIERELKDALRAETVLSEYYGMMQYHMGWLDETLSPSALSVQGKRLRPILCLLCNEAVGGQIEHALPAAAAIELVHNFSLIHDDIEDGSPTRRHRPTVWKLWGVAQAINCGDGMYTKAMLALGRLAEQGVPLERVYEAQRAFAETCLVLTEGQYLDMTFETRMDVDLDSYLRMIRGKSAALIACSAQLGALLGGASWEVVRAYAQFGENLGMAFQVVDDILGIWGAEGETGKSALSDIRTRKKTLPVVYALDDADLLALYAKEELEADDVAHVVTILEERGARDYAEGMAETFSRRAVESLDQAGGDSPARQAIGELARSLLARRS